MPRSRALVTVLLLAAAAAAHAPAAQAHRAWMLPSATVVSGAESWVTVDAAVSNDLFYFEHQPLRLDNLAVTAPDGTAVVPQNASTGRYRSTFDVPLKQQGTWQFAVVNDSLFASWKEDGKTRRWRGTVDAFAKDVPADAPELQVTHGQGRIETYVTLGSPSTGVFTAKGRGLELAPVTHPNDLVEGETATFHLLLDGKPAPDVKVLVVYGGIRYRDKLGEATVTTDAEGRFAFKWPAPGMYWIEASVRDANPALKVAKERRASYSATFEVLPR